jgi:hypothetical protein
MPAMAWDKARILEINRNSRHEKYKEPAHMTRHEEQLTGHGDPLSEPVTPPSIIILAVTLRVLCYSSAARYRTLES